MHFVMFTPHFLQVPMSIKNAETLRLVHTRARSTLIGIFLKMHLFLSVFGSRQHGDGVIIGHRKRSFSKTLSTVDHFENTVFLLSCGRVKTDLLYIRACSRFFGDHTRAICLFVLSYRSSNVEYHDQYRISLLNIMIEYQISNVTAFSCGRRYL